MDDKVKLFNEKTKNDYNELDHIDNEILKLIIKFPGISAPKIAALIGIERKNVLKRRKKKQFKRALFNYQKTSLELITDLHRKAINKLKEHIDSENERTSLDAIKEIIKGINPDNQQITGEGGKGFEIILTTKAKKTEEK